jgi:cell division septation protein DedD
MLEIIMASIEQKVEQFAQQIIELHGFRFNEGFSCLIPDKDPFPANEGLFLWGFSQKRMRFETKIEKFHTSTRMKRMDQMLGLSEKEYKKLFSSVDTYLKSLKALGFEEIGKGVTLFGKTKVYNVQADASMFENKLEELKQFELLTLKNPIIEFAEKQGYFQVKNRSQLAWDKTFGNATGTAAGKGTSKSASKAGKSTGKTGKASGKSTAKLPAKLPAKSSTKLPAKSSAKPTAKSAAKPTAKATVAKSTAKVVSKAKPTGKLTPSSKAAPLGEKLKKLADSQPVLSFDDKTWIKQVNALYKDVRSWLSEHSKKGYLTFNSHKITVSDVNGNYDIDSLELDLVGDRQVVFQPVEMNMPGAVGRVDLYHRGYNTRKVMLLLVNTSTNNFRWELWKSLNNKGHTFGKQTLEGLLTQWLES